MSLPEGYQPLGKNGIYSEEDCNEMVKKMDEVSSTFYHAAKRTGHHQFVEFTGLMNKYIQIFRQTVKAGIDPNACNIHVGESLVMHDHDVAYMAEKFGCIFETTLKDPAMRDVFLREMGWEDLVQPTQRLTERQKQILESLVTMELRQLDGNVEQDENYRTELTELELLIAVPVTLPF